jgi:hypothetical protein
MLQEGSFMVASVFFLTFHFPVPGSLFDSFLSLFFIIWALFNFFFVSFQPKMEIHSKPLNYLSVPTAPADSAAAHPVKAIVCIPSWLGEGVIALKMTVELLRRTQGGITKSLLHSPEQGTVIYYFPASYTHSDLCLLLLVTQALKSHHDRMVLRIILWSRKREVSQKLVYEYITKFSVLKGLNISQAAFLSLIFCV